MSYKVPSVAPGKNYQKDRDKILARIDEVLSNGNLILRQELNEFECKFSNFIGTKYAVGVNSGFDAIHLSLRAIGFKDGDEVLTVSHSCVATINPIIHAGAKPVFVDIAEDFNIDVDLIELAITEKTRAILIVHLNGRACNMERIQEIADKYKLIIVEDCAQAIGAKFDSRFVGSFGRAGCFSFYPLKMLCGLGDGGMICTNNKEIFEKVSYLRDYGLKRSTWEPMMVGFNAKLDNLNAAILQLKLDRLPEYISHRRHIAELYTNELKPISGLITPSFSQDRYYDVFQRYIVRAIKQRRELFMYLIDKGVEVTGLSNIPPLHICGLYGSDEIYLPMTETIENELIRLPINSEITDEQAMYCVSCIRQFFKDI